MKMKPPVSGILLLFLSWFLVFPGTALAQESKGKKDVIVVHISHFRPSVPATMQKSLGSLEKKLAPLGATVEWHEFKQTTDSILALSSGSIDIVVGGVEGQVAALASGVPLEIMATGPHGHSITGWYTSLLVQESSPVKKVSELKGKKIAVGKGGFSEAMLSLVCKKAGLAYPRDIVPVYLPTGEARSAFESGLVDALLTLDPYTPFIEKTTKFRILTDNEQVGYPMIWSVSVNKKFAEEHPELVKVIAREFRAVGPWIAENRPEAAAALSKVVGFDEASWLVTLGRASYVMESVNEKTLPDLQFIADQLLELSIIRKKVDVASAVWKESKSAP